LTPGSRRDARELRESLSIPAKGVTVLCSDPPTSRVGGDFLVKALEGRAATVFVGLHDGLGGQGQGEGHTRAMALAASLASGLGVKYM
ncbi:unnamed protein product, partial [Discosporangium mesarthrocarpum]